MLMKDVVWILIIKDLLDLEKDLLRGPHLPIISRIANIKMYDNDKYGEDLNNIIEILPEIYAEALILGLEQIIVQEIREMKRKYKNEVRAIENNSLKMYEVEICQV